MSAGASLWLAVRSLLWTILLPGLFAGVLPWRYFGLSRVVIDPRSPRDWLGLAAIGIGVVLLGACIWEFARRGRGTLAPVDPPTALVVWFVAANLFVIGYEEPALRRRFGPAYDRYRATVGRWVPGRPG